MAEVHALQVRMLQLCVVMAFGKSQEQALALDAAAVLQQGAAQQVAGSARDQSRNRSLGLAGKRFIEVKTTDFGAATPFYVSRNEVAFSEERGAQFVLARVHEFRSAPKFFELKGSIRKNVLLDAVSFMARL